MSEIRDAIRSLLPGRLRLRHPMLYKISTEEIESLRDLLLGIEGMTEVTINPNVGSALLFWNPQVLTEEVLLETLNFYAEMFLDTTGEVDVPTDTKSLTTGKPILSDGLTRVMEKGLSSVETTVVRGFTSAAKTLTPTMAQKNGRRAARVLQNRTMLGLFTGSIAALAVKQTGWHVGLGAAFMALLLVHLQQHRRVL